ncbi:MAG TPA: penicillin-binding protein [Blastocatellia bacterium]|nr:penicillin-binding protein [Blastocatellia bacterium]
MQRTRQRKLRQPTRRPTRQPADAGRRALWIASALCFWMFVIMGRLMWLQVARHDHYSERAALNQRKEVKVVAARGPIVDREERELAVSAIADSVYVDLKQLKEEAARERAAGALSPLLGFDQSELLKRLAGDSSFLWLKRKLDPETSRAVTEAVTKNNLRGVAIQKESQRFYPNDSLAASVIGYVDSYDNGLAGVEQKYDDLLSGKAGEIAFDRDAVGRPYNRSETPAVNGAQVVLTIDAVLQHRVEVLLDEAVRMTRAKGAGAIVMDPKTGEILALANVPTFNPNERPVGANDSSRANRAIGWPYEPGSIFKVVTYAAAFEEGLFEPDDMINCGGGQITIGKRVIRDTHAYGALTVEDAFAKSSNGGAIRIAQRLGREKFSEYISQFGFGRKTGIELPGESRGIVNPLEDWRIDSIGSVAIGQEVSVTLLQIVAAVGAIANRGVWVKPHVVKKIMAQDGRALYEPKIETRQVVSERTAQMMVRLMERVVTHGTARRAINLAGYSVAGKTGTPQKVENGRMSQTKYMPSFAGFVPAADPRLAIVVMVDEPQGNHQGGSVAAPVFNLIAEAALGDYVIPPDDKAFRDSLAALSKEYESEGGEGRESEIEGQGQEIEGQGSKVGAVNNLRTSVLDGAQVFVMPDFRGRGVRAVTQACAHMNLVISLNGSGLAFRQSPAAGAKVRAGETCKVQFQ